MEQQQSFSTLTPAEVATWTFILAFAAMGAMFRVMRNNQWKSWRQTVGLAGSSAIASGSLIGIWLLFFPAAYRYPFIVALISGGIGMLSKNVQERLFLGIVETYSQRKGRRNADDKDTE